jgi:glycosyltransferase involved in cell wall biosynthesis
MLSLSIIICTKDRPRQLQRCLETILRQSALPDEIVVVDASSNDLAHKVVNSFIKANPRPIFHYIHTRPSTAYQRNVGFDMARGDIIGSVDDDTELAPDVLGIIREVFEDSQNKDVGGVMPKIINPDDNKRGQWSLSTLYKRIFFLSHSVALRVRILPSGFPVFPFRRAGVSKPQKAEVLNGLYFYRRKVAKSFKFYEGFRGYSFMEDAEFSYRVSKHYRLLYIPTAEVLHLHVNVSRSSYYELYKQIVENHYYFFTKAVKGTFLNWLAFYWSHIGLFISYLL